MILSLFIDVKSIQVISGFNLKRMKKIARWGCGTKISKTNLKTRIYPLLTRPQGPVVKDTIDLHVLSIFQIIFRMNGLKMVLFPTIMTLGLSVCELFTLVKLSAQWLFR